MSRIITFVSTNGIAMFQNTLELNSESSVFGSIGGIYSEKMSCWMFATVMNVDRFYYHYGDLDDFKRQFPDWEQFMADRDIAYFSKTELGGFVVVKDVKSN